MIERGHLAISWGGKKITQHLTFLLIEISNFSVFFYFVFWRMGFDNFNLSIFIFTASKYLLIPNMILIEPVVKFSHVCLIANQLETSSYEIPS